MLQDELKAYHARGAARTLWACTDTEVLIEGPVGTGKSRACLEKLHAICDNFKGIRALIVRQVRASLASTIQVTFEDEVLPDKHALQGGPSREHRYSYQYKNGSEIVLGGLDDPVKFRSGEFDIIYIPEATQVGEGSVDELKTRLRHGKFDYHQLMMDCNPDSEQHWLNKRCIRGQTTRLVSRLQDNPKFYDNGAWTQQGISYIATLGGLDGHLYERLVLGKWCNPEGARFKGASRHRQGFSFVEEFPNGIPDHYKRWIAIDYGKADPYCALWIARDDAGSYWVYQEDYETGFEADEQVLRVVSRSPDGERYEGVWMDGSMWQKGDYARGFGAQRERGSAAKQYWEELKKSEHEGRFGSLHRGHRNEGERNYVDISAMLSSGALRIEIGCTHTWDEIEGAVHWKDPRTGIVSELVNPGGRKYCPDHALDCLGYGICNRSPVTTPVEYEAIDLEEARVAQLAEQVEKYEEFRTQSEVPQWMRSTSRWVR